MWITAETLLATVREIGASVANTPARTLVFLNGHGGNIALLQVALREIRRLTGLHTFLMNVGVDAAEHENGFGIHGGHGETSLLMHVRPDLVDASLFERGVPDSLADLERIRFNGGAVAFGWVSNDFGPSGVIGDPTGSSAEIGAALFDQLVLDGVASLTEIASFPGRLA
jgi:creatinine amidohydrolase